MDSISESCPQSVISFCLDVSYENDLTESTTMDAAHSNELDVEKEQVPDL